MIELTIAAAWASQAAALLHASAGRSRTPEVVPAPSPVPPARIPQPGDDDFDPDLYPRPPWVAVNTPYMEFALKTGLRSSGTGEVSVRRSGYTLNPVIGPESDTQISLPFDYETSTYRFSGTNLLPGGAAPVHNTYQIIFAPNIDARLSEEWGVVGGLVGIWAGEFGTHDGGAGTYGAFAGAKYHLSDNLKITVGLSGITRMEKPAAIVPIGGIEWQIDERTLLRSEGNLLRFEHEIDRTWTFRSTISYESRSFRLDEATPGLAAHGVWRDTRVPLIVGLDFSPHPAAKFMLSGGVILWQEFTLDDRFGSHLARHRADPTGLLVLAMEFYF